MIRTYQAFMVLDLDNNYQEMMTLDNGKALVQW